jgi:hypothetical protein
VDGRSAQDLYDKRIPWFTPEMRRSARDHGCLFHRAWYARDGSAFYALALWETREGAGAFYRLWGVEDEPGEETIQLEGDLGLAPVPNSDAPPG